MQFKAALFDFDGTVTYEGQFQPAKEMSERLLALSKKMPIGFCTGRQLESFERNGLHYILDVIDPREHQDFLKNMFLFAENGAVGYHYSEEILGFKEFYRVDWPEKFWGKESFKEALVPAVAKFGELYENAHKIVVVIRTKHHHNENRDMNAVYRCSGKIYDETCALLEKFDPHYEDYLHVGNSGIGVVVGPANGDKNVGIKRFAEFLSEKRGLDFGPEFREVLAVGDRPLYGGNDHYFLKGDIGTPYTVGDVVEAAPYPLTVSGSDGERLVNAKATIHLIDGLLECY